MPQAEKDFVLPPDANVNISQLTRLFSRPNAVVRRADGNNDEPVGKTVGFYDVEDNGLGFDDDDGGDFGGDNGGFTFAYGEEDDDQAAGEDDDVDYNVDGFDEVRKVEKIDIGYATVAKKVDVRRLKKDLWSELEEKTAWVAPEDFQDEKRDDDEKRTKMTSLMMKNVPRVIRSMFPLRILLKRWTRPKARMMLPYPFTSFVAYTWQMKRV